MPETINVLDHGTVRLLNIAGPTRRANAVFDADDTDPANVARMSFNSMDSGRTRSDDLRLCRYLMENRHCYRGDMQVLTASGWLRWDELKETETFFIPDPLTKTYKKETLKVDSFKVNEPLYTFSNDRMSYAVTSEHSMWFKGKYQRDFSKVQVQDMSKWGWFEPSKNYSLGTSSTMCLKLAFTGFYLGDGSYASTNKITFHLLKGRKKDYLEMLLNRLDLPYTVKDSGKKNCLIYTVTTPDFLLDYIKDISTRAFKLDKLQYLSIEELKGLFDGLVASSGYIREYRPQISFTSSSKNLATVFELVGTLLGYDVHSVRGKEGYYSKTAYKRNRTTLESRKHYHDTNQYSGKVYCTTSSTGLLAVRGSEDTFGFICGNSTPFEMIVVWAEMKLPIMVARQFVRHRTVSINEVSARYTKLPAKWYIPDVVGSKPTNGIKQGRGNDLSYFIQDNFKEDLHNSCKDAYDKYENYLEAGVAPEHARLFLHVNHYTKWVWKQDLHNLMHFLSLRDHSHAQGEAMEYARAVDKLVRQVLPESMELYDKYRRKQPRAKSILHHILDYYSK